ncbi:tetratricopeptide repeat protein, partial [Chloroflexi bacterium TSY]|nr:tetratricopeptide repeat protein [Chloroflexi bacterium TSY]
YILFFGLALMELYGTAGQWAEAHHQYQTCVRILDEELGVPPTEETEKVYATIRARQQPNQPIGNESAAHDRVKESDIQESSQSPKVDRQSVSPSSDSSVRQTALDLANELTRQRLYLHLAGKQVGLQFVTPEAFATLSQALSLTAAPEWLERYTILLAREQIYHLQGTREAQAADLAALTELVEKRQFLEGKAEVALRWAGFAIATDDYPRAISQAKVAIAAAQATHDREREAAGQLAWGETLWREAAYSDAQAHLLYALRLYRKIDSRAGEGLALNYLGLVGYQEGNYAESSAYCSQALSITREIDDRIGEGLALNNLGLNDWHLGNYTQARTYLEQALAIRQQLGDQQGARRTLNNLGICANDQGDWAGARTYLEQALALAREMKSRRSEGLALCNLGEITSSQGEYVQSDAYLKQAWIIAQEIDDQRIKHLALNNLGGNAMSQGNYREAEAYLQQVLAVAQEMGDQRSISLVLNGLGQNAIALGHYLQADIHLKQALIHSRAISDQNVEGMVLNSLGWCALGQEMVANARTYFEQSLTMTREIGKKQTAAAALTGLGATLVELEQLADAIEVLQVALPLRQALGHAGLMMEAVAELARVHLAQNAISQAMADIEQILTFLETGGSLDGTLWPLRIHLICYCALLANRDPRSKGVLQAAHKQLQTTAEQLLEDDRHDYLEQIPWHREIQSASRGEVERPSAAQPRSVRLGLNIWIQSI